MYNMKLDIGNVLMISGVNYRVMRVEKNDKTKITLMHDTWSKMEDKQMNYPGGFFEYANKNDIECDCEITIIV